MNASLICHRAGVAALLLAAAAAVPAAAQQGTPGWFVPQQGQPPAAGTQRQAPARRVPIRREPVAPVQAAPLPDLGPAAEEQTQPIPDLPQPPVPSLPDIPKGAAPPAPIMGVLGVPDVMRASSAAQAVEKVIGERRDRLRADAERAQQTWRQMQQQLQADAPKLTPDQGHARERALRDRVAADQKALRDRARIVQEAAQVAAGQIERTLVSVIRQVAQSRGMNLVLHRSQVALNTSEFDISDQVAQQLNKVLPTVQIPPDGVDPATLPKDWGSTPAAAPAGTAATAPAKPVAAAPTGSSARPRKH